MNRDMLKLRKDPTIQPLAATVTTYNTTAFPVSPRLGSTSAESRVSGNRNRTSPKSSGQTATSTSATTTSAASITSTFSAPSSVANAPNAPAGTAGTGVAGVSVGPGVPSVGPGSASGSSKSFGNGYTQHLMSSNDSSSDPSRQRNGQGRTRNTFKFDTNGALWALSASPDFSMVAVVGRDVLKILSVTDTGAEETINLKTVGIRNNFAGSMDVKWGPTSGRDAKIATIGTNGPIVIWNIGTHNKIDRTIKEHTRSVNRICFSSQDPNLLLSASSDSTVRLWDLRFRDRPGLVMETKDIVREVQFNPVSTNDIVAGYESGNIQRWDLRNLSMSEKKFMGHMGFVTSLDYHPNGRFLASGGRDRTIKIWDMDDEKRREIHTIPTIQYTSKVQWRPNKPYHLAASFKDEATVQVFDVRRPYVPIHVISRHDKDATSILWRDTDVLWSVSKDKTFTSTYVKTQTLFSDLLPSGAGAMNCYGQLAFTVAPTSGADLFEKDLVPRLGRPNAKSVALDGSPEAMMYRTRQTGGVFDCELFNHEAFIYCAQNYSTDAGDIKHACEHNANIAWQASRYRDSQTWTALKLFYSDMAEHAVVVSQNDAPSTDAVSGPKAIDEVTQDDDEDSDASETPLSKPAATVPSLFAIKVSDAPIKRDWSHQETIRSLLEYYAEQGEVQMCVTILLVLADEKDVPEFSRSQQWFASYIDLLSRFKLWSAATAVSQACTDPGIHTMNQDSTTIHTSCSSCMKPILTRAPTSTGFWACDRCRKVLSSCAVCNKTVRGIFTWCTHCSHGFHLQHAQEWFSQSAECPTGCGHQCFPEMLKIQEYQEQLLLQQTPEDDETLELIN
ncbi:WD repeat-containing protein 24 [Mortierella polycephala]|uniref:WD repeat-containing protein 24 n=1 Tax=Mortierella polycephala TaxID=41804 RepID=A0A9P6Q999_9FUNG|nr:WD repeat-containing protein 24 [Mortierella polycephala]